MVAIAGISICALMVVHGALTQDGALAVVGVLGVLGFGLQYVFRP